MEINNGDTAWVLASTALVMLMTPGVGLFYGGLVRSKTVVSMIGLSFLAFALASIQWVLFGYSLAFGTDINGFIGGLNYVGLSGVGVDSAPLAGNIPHLIYMAFQLVFAAVNLAILTSAVAERGSSSAPSSCWRCSGPPWFMIPWPIGSGRAAGWPRWGLWTLQAEQWCT